jgi:hypothetical protein
VRKTGRSSRHLQTRGFTTNTILLLMLSATLTWAGGEAERASAASLDCAFAVSAPGVLAHRTTNGRLEGVCTFSADRSWGAIPEDVLAPPGRYTVDVGGRAVSVDARTSGLYQLYIPGVGNRQFVVWSRRDGIEFLMRHLAGLTAHGTRHDQLDPEQLIAKASTEVLSITCGTAVDFTARVLSTRGIQTRRVVTYTREPTNGVDDGHIMLEVLVDGTWSLYDPDLGTRFIATNTPLGAASLAAGRRPVFGQTVRFYAPEHRSQLDYSSLKDSSGYDFTFLELRSRANDRAIERWYRRVIGLVGIETGDGVVVATRFPRDNAIVLSWRPTARIVSVDELSRL